MTVTTTSAPGAVQLSSRIDASTSPANASQIAGKGAEPDRVPAICKAQAGGHRVTRRSLMNMFVGTAAVAGAATIAGTEILSDPWHAQLEAENKFREAQTALAKVRAKDMNELEIKAAAAYIYDAERMSSYGRLAIISYGVTLDLMRMKLAREDAAA